MAATESLIAEVAAEETRRILDEQDELVGEFLELRDVMAILRVQETKARALIRSGELGSIQPGKKILVPRAEVIRFANQQFESRRKR